MYHVDFVFWCLFFLVVNHGSHNQSEGKSCQHAWKFIVYFSLPLTYTIAFAQAPKVLFAMSWIYICCMSLESPTLFCLAPRSVLVQKWLQFVQKLFLGHVECDHKLQMTCWPGRLGSTCQLRRGLDENKGRLGSN